MILSRSSLVTFKFDAFYLLCMYSNIIYPLRILLVSYIPRYSGGGLNGAAVAGRLWNRPPLQSWLLCCERASALYSFQ